MPNLNNPRGLRPIEYLSGADWNGQVRQYFIPQADANAYAIGDPVTLGGSASAEGIPSIVLATPGSGLLGVIVGMGGLVNGGVSADPTNLNTTVIPATKTRGYYVLVCDDPNVVFEVQEIGTGTTLVAADVGLNTNLVAGANNGFTSGWQMANASKATTATLDVKILGLVQKPGNGFGQYAKFRVILNNHLFNAGTLGL